MATFVRGDRVCYDENVGTVKEVTDEGYLVRWESGEEIEECTGDLVPACEAGIALDKWPYSKPCRNPAEGESPRCLEHQ